MKMSTFFVCSRRTLVVCIATILLAHVVSVRGVEIGTAVKVGTTGFGADVTFGLAETMNLRAGLSMLSLSFDFEDDDDDDELTLNIDLQTIPLLLDWHPWRNNFRLSGGIMLNNNELSLEADAGEEVTLNDVEYRVDSLSMDVAFDTVSPYLGIGYGNAVRQGGRWRFAFDFGVMFHGTPKVTGRAEASNPALQERLNRDFDEELEELRDDLSGFTMYPVLTLGLSYRF